MLCVLFSTPEGHGDDASADATEPGRTPSPYARCDPGCPDGSTCNVWGQIPFCVPRCTDHDECATGYCGENDRGERVCAGIRAMRQHCAWGSATDCVTAELAVGQACDSVSSMSVTLRNGCATPVRVFACITVAGSTWDCRADDVVGGLPPGQSMTHSTCKSGGYYRYFATAYDTFETHHCIYPQP